jgi:hypothetical protein
MTYFKKLSNFELLCINFSTNRFVMKSPLLSRLLLISVLLLLVSGKINSQDLKKLNQGAARKLKSWTNPLKEWQHIGKIKMDSVRLYKENNSLKIWFSPILSYYPMREDLHSVFVQSIKKSLGRKYRKYNIGVFTNGYPLEQMIPNYYRKIIPVDSSRFLKIKETKPVLVKKLNIDYPANGLSGNAIALWHSHGYFFEMTLDRWEWQRARLFGTVEDISVMGYVLPYLTKMLENSGANVFLPRERDVQTHEVIVDNDRSTGSSEVVIHLNNTVQKINEGFFLKDTLYPGVNPFKKGSSLRIQNDSADFIPDIPATGDYAVYISYPRRADNTRSAKYSVSHSGGTTEFAVDQTIGGESWLYLGTFHFLAGKNVGIGSVRVRNGSTENAYVALDAVRFGGGMGNVARRPSSEIITNQKSVNENLTNAILPDSLNSSRFTWKLSGKPRYLEGSRYYLQYAGMPDTLVYSPNTNKNDYNDDYQSRGMWVNYLMGNIPANPDKKQLEGLGLPIDLSLAFHTDAGVTSNDSIIGTLAIYSTGADNGKFPDGSSRMASRDLSDIIQSQIIDDIRKVYDPDWTRRGIWDRPYSEARRPNAPAMLLELLSHQNLADQRYGLDPRFRFAVSRAIYKGILKYISYTEHRPYVVHPLPVTRFAITPATGKTVRLSWKPVTDSLETSSRPDRFRIYKRTGDNGFDNGILVENPSTEIELESYDTIYSFKVTAINAGGESFDSEILSVGIKAGETKSVLVVNGFDRISGPASFDVQNKAGVEWWNDRGVADHSEISFVGDQYDFDRRSPWLDDDSPGWGASYGNMEGRIIQGNSFDYPYIHGKSILAAGHSFYSVSNEYFRTDENNTPQFKIIDLIFGEEKSTPFFNDTSRIDYKIYTPELIKKIKELTIEGVSIFLSGAYIGTDLFPVKDSTALKFASEVLHFKPRTGHAVKNGEVYATDYVKPVFTGTLSFNTGFSEKIYSVESPDAIEPSGKGAITGFRYSENNSSAGVVFRGKYKVVNVGFPFETITDENERNRLMKQILDFFEH